MLRKIPATIVGVSLLLGTIPFSFAAPASQLAVEAIVTQNGSIPRGAQRVPMLTLRLRASCGGDVPVTSITLVHEGLGDAADLIRVYALRNRIRMTRGYQFSGDTGLVRLRFRGFVIRACTSETILIAADYSQDAAAGGEHRLILERAQDIDAGGADVTSTITISPQIARTVGVTEGNIDVTYLKLPKVVRYGRNKTVARIRLEADTIDDHLIHSMLLTNDGSASDGDLQNLFYTDSRRNRISTKAVQMDGDKILLRFEPPLLLSKNETKVIELHADVFASRRRTIAFDVKEPSDIEATVKRGRN